MLLLEAQGDSPSCDLATNTRQAFSDNPPLSCPLQALHWCNFDSPDQAGGSCRSGTWLGAALARLAASNNRPGGDGLPPERCLPYDPLAGPAGGARAACVPRGGGQGCGGRRPAYSDGSFAFFDLLEQWVRRRV
jgi:hypothetical protein